MIIFEKKFLQLLNYQKFIFDYLLNKIKIDNLDNIKILLKNNITKILIDYKIYKNKRNDFLLFNTIFILNVLDEKYLTNLKKTDIDKINTIIKNQSTFNNLNLLLKNYQKYILLKKIDLDLLKDIELLNNKNKIDYSMFIDNIKFFQDILYYDNYENYLNNIDLKILNLFSEINDNKILNDIKQKIITLQIPELTENIKEKIIKKNILQNLDPKIFNKKIKEILNNNSLMINKILKNLIKLDENYFYVNFYKFNIKLQILLKTVDYKMPKIKINNLEGSTILLDFYNDLKNSDTDLYYPNFLQDLLLYDIINEDLYYRMLNFYIEKENIISIDILKYFYNDKYQLSENRLNFNRLEKIINNSDLKNYNFLNSQNKLNNKLLSKKLITILTIDKDYFYNNFLNITNKININFIIELLKYKTDYHWKRTLINKYPDIKNLNNIYNLEDMFFFSHNTEKLIDNLRKYKLENNYQEDNNKNYFKFFKKYLKDFNSKEYIHLLDNYYSILFNGVTIKDILSIENNELQKIAIKNFIHNNELKNIFSLMIKTDYKYFNILISNDNLLKIPTMNLKKENFNFIKQFFNNLPNNIIENNTTTLIKLFNKNNKLNDIFIKKIINNNINSEEWVKNIFDTFNKSFLDKVLFVDKSFFINQTFYLLKNLDKLSDDNRKYLFININNKIRYFSINNKKEITKLISNIKEINYYIKVSLYRLLVTTITKDFILTNDNINKDNIEQFILTFNEQNQINQLKQIINNPKNQKIFENSILKYLKEQSCYQYKLNTNFETVLMIILKNNFIKSKTIINFIDNNFNNFNNFFNYNKNIFYSKLLTNDNYNYIINNLKNNFISNNFYSIDNETLKETFNNKLINIFDKYQEKLNIDFTQSYFNIRPRLDNIKRKIFRTGTLNIYFTNQRIEYFSFNSLYINKEKIKQLKLSKSLENYYYITNILDDKVTLKDKILGLKEYIKKLDNKANIVFDKDLFNNKELKLLKITNFNDDYYYCDIKKFENILNNYSFDKNKYVDKNITKTIIEFNDFKDKKYLSKYKKYYINIIQQDLEKYYIDIINNNKNSKYGFYNYAKKLKFLSLEKQQIMLLENNTLPLSMYLDEKLIDLFIKNYDYNNPEILTKLKLNNLSFVMIKKLFKINNPKILKYFEDNLKIFYSKLLKNIVNNVNFNNIEITTRIDLDNYYSNYFYIDILNKTDKDNIDFYIDILNKITNKNNTIIIDFLKSEIEQSKIEENEIIQLKNYLLNEINKENENFDNLINLYNELGFSPIKNNIDNINKNISIFDIEKEKNFKLSQLIDYIKDENLINILLLPKNKQVIDFIENYLLKKDKTISEYDILIKNYLLLKNKLIENQKILINSKSLKKITNIGNDNLDINSKLNELKQNIDKIENKLLKYEQYRYKDINLKLSILKVCIVNENKNIENIQNINMNNLNMKLFNQLNNIYNKKDITMKEYFLLNQLFDKETVISFVFQKDIINNKFFKQTLNTYDKLKNFNLKRYYLTKSYFYKKFDEILLDKNSEFQEFKENIYILENLMYIYDYDISKINQFLFNFTNEKTITNYSYFEEFNKLHLINFKIIKENNKYFLKNNFLNVIKVIKNSNFENSDQIINLFFEKYNIVSNFSTDYVLNKKEIINIINKIVLLETNINDKKMLEALIYNNNSGLNNSVKQQILNLTTEAENLANRISENLINNSNKNYNYPMPFIISPITKIKNEYYMYANIPAFDELIYGLGYATNSCMTLDGISSDILEEVSKNENDWNSYVGFKLNPKYKNNSLNKIEKDLMNKDFQLLNKLVNLYNKEILLNNNNLKNNEILLNKKEKIMNIVKNYFVINYFGITWIRDDQATMDNFQGNNNVNVQTDTIDYHIKKLDEYSNICNEYSYLQTLKELLKAKKEKKKFDEIIIKNKPFYVMLGSGYTNPILYSNFEKKNKKIKKFDYFKEKEFYIYSDAEIQTLINVHKKYDLNSPIKIITHFKNIYDNNNIEEINKLIKLQEKTLLNNIIINNNINNEIKQELSNC